MISCSLPLPPALNSAFRAAIARTGRPYTYKTTEAKRWQSDACLLLNASRKTKETIEGPVSVTVTLLLKIDRDIDSSHKLLLDTLQESGILKNDKQVQRLETIKMKDKNNPRVIITLEELYVATG